MAKPKKAPSKTVTAFKPRAVIFDIDGTLADSHHRSQMITDWTAATNEQIEAYAAAMALDTPIPSIVELARTMHTAGFAVLLLTSRDCTQYERTRQWMKDHGIPFEKLYVRTSIDDRRPNPIYKAEQLALIQQNYEIEFAIDDESRVVKMFRDAGVMCLQCPSWEK